MKGILQKCKSGFFGKSWAKKLFVLNGSVLEVHIDEKVIKHYNLSGAIISRLGKDIKEGASKVSTSSIIGLVPSIPANTIFPILSSVFFERKSAEGLGISSNPFSYILKIPVS